MSITKLKKSKICPNCSGPTYRYKKWLKTSQCNHCGYTPSGKTLWGEEVPKIKWDENKVEKGKVGRSWQKRGKPNLVEEYKGHKIYDNDGTFTHQGPSLDNPNIKMSGIARNIQEARNNIDEYLNTKKAIDSVSEDYKDMKDIKDEAQPQKPKTKLQDKIIGDVKYMERKELLRKIDDIMKKNQHSRHSCMECSESPTTEIKWAEGMAHAWFCDKHLKEFKDKKDGWHDIDAERKLKYGIASEKWSNLVTQKEAADYYVKHPEVEVNIKKQVKVYLSGNEMPPSNEEIMQGEKGGRYYIAQDGGGGPVLPEEQQTIGGEEPPQDQLPLPGQQLMPQQVGEEKKEPEPEIIAPEDNKDKKLQMQGYTKIKLLKTIAELNEKIKENEKGKENEAIVSKGNLLVNLNNLINKSGNVNLIDAFLKGYKEVAMLGKEYPDYKVDSTYNIAKQVNMIKEFGLAMDGSDRIEKVISIDSVAHALHNESKEYIEKQRENLIVKGFDNASNSDTIPHLYPVLDELAGISKDLGEENRDDRLLFLNKSFDTDINRLNNVEILQKSVDFDSGPSYWSLMKRAIKDGVDSLDDDEVVLLREWIYARI